MLLEGQVILSVDTADITRLPNQPSRYLTIRKIKKGKKLLIRGTKVTRVDLRMAEYIIIKTGRKLRKTRRYEVSFVSPVENVIARIFEE